MKLLGPNIYLFAYHLIRDNPGDKNPLWAWCERTFLPNFRRNCPDKTLVSQLIFPPKQDYVQLLPQLTEDFDLEKPGITGFIEPLQLQDSYGIWVNIGYVDETLPEATIETGEFIKLVNPENCLKIPSSKDFLGQTLLVTICLEPSRKGELKDIANEVFQKLFPTKNPDFNFAREGTLLDSPIFEYGLISQIDDNYDNYAHILVWFPDKNTEAKFGKYQHELIDLFFYRQKIIKAFQDSRIIYHRLDDNYKKIDATLKVIQVNDDSKMVKLDRDINKLQDDIPIYLKDSLDYTNLLRTMADLENTISINLYNYKETLKRIYTQEKSQKSTAFLSLFSKETAPYFLAQIKGDLGYFQNGTNISDQAINAIRGIVEIEQTKIDRSLEKTLQIIGAGLGGGGIAASSLSGYIKEPLVFKPGSSIHPGFSAFILSILIAFLSGIIIALINGKLAEWCSNWKNGQKKTVNK
jgi:hypothetical protein